MLVGQTPEFNQYEGAFTYANGVVFQKNLTAPSLLAVSDFLTANLTNAGSSVMRVNGSVTPVAFEYVVPVNQFLILSQINIVIADAAITATKFGGITALTNGILWQVLDTDNTVLYSFSATGSVKANYEFYAVSGTSIDVTSSTDLVSVNWNAVSIGALMGLSAGQKIRITVRDDLTTLDAMTTTIQGRLVTNDVVINY